MKVQISKLIEKKKTYPSWTTGSRYCLKSKQIDNQITEVFYVINKGIKRTIKRSFPKEIEATPKFSLALGLIKGEGPNALGKSNYRRFTFTNSDPKVINFVLNQLEEQNIFKKKFLINKSVHLIHAKESDEKVIFYWSKKLKISRSKFKCFRSERRTTKYGVCHVYISDVLLRRILDLLIEKIIN